MVQTFSGSLSSYPKIRVSSKISLFSFNPLSTIPVHSKNWFSDFELYSATKNSIFPPTLFGYMNDPPEVLDPGNPIVESTLIVTELNPTTGPGNFSVTFVFAPILKEPKCADLSNDNL